MLANVLDLVGRVFISAIFLLGGINKIQNYEGSHDWMESLGIPGILLIPAIVLEVLAPILIIVGYQVKISAALFKSPSASFNAKLQSLKPAPVDFLKFLILSISLIIYSNLKIYLDFLFFD